ncbi:hypothetical protein DSO57_1017112 [Entomophthora muscae]|uniref:Uncharacterized protein n=1 Tax=Entomophthora muscae TaxID=34485 RepID=A0ACC2UFE8_9FUNG|nr:hypothetical protein DSO57_1017112 [Entomophthora muscae]
MAVYLELGPRRTTPGHNPDSIRSSKNLEPAFRECRKKDDFYPGWYTVALFRVHLTSVLIKIDSNAFAARPLSLGQTKSQPGWVGLMYMNLK